MTTKIEKIKTERRKFVSLLSTAVLLTSLTLNSTGSAQTPATASNNPSSVEAMEGVNLQRTAVYQARGVNQISGLLWKSEKLFEINYAFALTPAFDNSLNSADIGFSEPILADGLIYFQLCISLNQNFVLALDKNTSRTVWMFKLKDALSAPAIASGVVYVLATDGNLYSLDAHTGAEKWRYSSKDQKWNIYSSPAVADGIVYFTSLGSSLFALDASTKQVKWIFKGKGMLTSPTFSNEEIYVGNEKGVLYAVDIQTGREKWNFKAKGRLGTPIVDNGTAYFRTGDGNLYAIDTKTGQQKWMTQIGGQVQPVFPVVSVKIGTSLAFYDDTIFFAGAEKGSDYLFGIGSRDGQQRWKFKVEGPCRSPIVADGVIYLGSFGNLYAVDAKTGTQKWLLKTKSEFEGKPVKNVASSPAVADATLYFVTDEGFFYAVK
jgi:outer membrane protein assembly factor BamB